ncbi:MAG: SOS response-associated peptidase [Longimicrobiales bacterium]|nr:SOS response-associated peptidase [Longimicrobiales bacterium]
MCGRYTLATPLGELVEVFDVGHLAIGDWAPRFNVAPTQLAPVVLADRDGVRRLGPLRWGLVPRWADDPALGSRLINARAETAAARPAFRDAFRHRRCLVPADGFYEWRAPAGGGGPRTPFHIHAPGERPFAMAGLWERWQPEGGEPLFTFTVLTVDAPPWLRGIHPRAPAILPAERWPAWLDPATPAPEAEAVLRDEPQGSVPATAGFLAEEVTTRVNRPAHDDPACREPLPGGERVEEG